MAQKIIGEIKKEQHQGMLKLWFHCKTLFTEPSVKDDVARKSGLEIKAADFEELPVSDVTVDGKKNFGTVNSTVQGW